MLASGTRSLGAFGALVLALALAWACGDDRGPAPGTMDLRFATPLAATSTCDMAPARGAALVEALVKATVACP